MNITRPKIYIQEEKTANFAGQKNQSDQNTNAKKEAKSKSKNNLEV